MDKSKTETKLLNGAKQKPTIGQTALLFLALTALTLFIGCSATEPQVEPRYTDFYEVKTYDVHTEVVTNEIVTTVFIQKFVETNKVVVVETEAEDFGGYEFEPIGEAPKGELEFQCLDGSCGVKK